jgi:hypothetical protein
MVGAHGVTRDESVTDARLHQASSFKLQASIASDCSLELSAVLYFASYFYVQKQAFVFHPYTSSLKMM